MTFPSRKTLNRIAIGAGAALAASVFPIAPALAADCNYQALGPSITVTATAGGITLGVDASEVITLNGDQCVDPGIGPVTTEDVDKIVVNGGPGTLVTFDMSGGEFEPGFSTETGPDDIEIEVTDNTNITLQGGSSADRWTVRTLGLDLNNDGDADVTGPAGAALVAGTTVFNGAGGNDRFIQAAGGSAQEMNGGSGTDEVDYSDRAVVNAATDGVTVTLDGAANDGGGAEGDNVANNIEEIHGTNADDTIDASLGTRSALLFGEAGADTITGSDFADILDGEDGDDNLSGGSARDSIRGGAGNDVIDGGTGKDQIRGEQGADTINGGGGADDFEFLGNEDLNNADGNDAVDGGGGRDTVDYGDRTEPMTIDLTAGTATQTAGANADADTLTSVENAIGGVANDVLVGTDGDGAKNTLSGGRGADSIDGLGARDRIFGGKGNDWLVGSGASDYISGGSGNDNSWGGDGADTLLGGSGDDSLRGGDGRDRMSGGKHDAADGCDKNGKDRRSGCELRIDSENAPMVFPAP